MKKRLLKYIFIIIGISFLLIIYLSIFGIETDKFNSQIKNKINQNDKNIEVDIKKIILTLNPLNFKVNAKTIAPKIFYKNKILELEYIQAQISLISLIKKQIVSSKLKISTKSISFKDLIAFARAASKKPELFILERAIKKGQIIVDINLNFDHTGKIKNDYEITTILKDGKIKLFKNFNFEKINFLLNVNNNVFDFKDIKFTKNKSKFFLENIKVTKNNKNFFIEGDIHNKDTALNNELLKFLNIDLEKTGFFNTNFNSNSKFSFLIDQKFKVKNLFLSSDIVVNTSKYKISNFSNNYLEIKKDIINLKNHKIKANLKKNNLTINGFGKIKIQENFDDIQYKFDLKDTDFKLNSQLKISELKLNTQEYLKNFIKDLDSNIILKDQKIEINFNQKELLLKGQGKIKFDNDYENIKFKVSKIKNKFNFNTEVDLDTTSFKIDFLNFVKNDSLQTQIKILGNFEPKNYLIFEDISIIDENNNLTFKNIYLDKDNIIEKVEKINLTFLDYQNKKNKILLKVINKNEYQIIGSSFNADKLINNLLIDKKNNQKKIFKNDFKISLNIKEVFLDNLNSINDLNGKLNIKNNEIYTANISGDFDNVNNLKFTVNTNDVGEKITTLFSSKAKPIVSRYKFIKGYEGGYLDFYSSKKDESSKSQLKIYDFKLKQLPALTKLLTLASLQGIADTLSGEGIRFNEFEMNFSNKNSLMTIDEIYAIGPAISILMNGYIEENKLISLRGTLVPATTINKSIGSIPFLGKILVGDKTGEGVFGVSFKIKGPPKELETTVNPIKTLTPRFITRTLEKIKKD